MTLTHLWTAVCLWAAVAASPERLYPALSGTVTLNCECPNKQCQAVYWYRYLNGFDFQFLLYYNTAGRETYGDGVDKLRTKGQVKEGARTMYSLRLTDLQQGDRGLYSCNLHNRNANMTELWPPGYLVMPGETDPTPTSVEPPKARRPKPCYCSNRRNYPPPEVCGQKVLWPLVSVVLGLGVILICTLYYFSRLPKKCRHQFAKTKQLS